MFVSAEVEARFWARINKKQGHGPKGECWVLSRQVDPKRYAKFAWVENGERKSMDAHRFVLTLTLGRIPEGLATHSCDFRPCCNPSHINEGTYKTNMQECKERGRLSLSPGARNPKAAKLSEVQVTEIRSLKRIGYSNRELGERFGVAHTTIGNIDRGIHWRSASK